MGVLVRSGASQDVAPSGSRAYPFGFIGNSSAAPPLGVLRAAPWIANHSHAIDRIGARVSVAGAAGSLVRLGIYLPDPKSGLPSTLLVDAGTIDGTNASFQEIAIARTLPPLAWLVSVAQGASPTMVTIGSSTSLPMTVLSSPGSAIKGYVGASGVTGALPANFGAVTDLTGADLPIVMVRFA